MLKLTSVRQVHCLECVWVGILTAPLCRVEATVVECSKSRPAMAAGAARRLLARAARLRAPPALALRLLVGRRVRSVKTM